MGNRLLSYFFLILCCILIIIGTIGQFILDNLVNVLILLAIFVIGFLIKKELDLNSNNSKDSFD